MSCPADMLESTPAPEVRLTETSILISNANNAETARQFHKVSRQWTLPALLGRRSWFKMVLSRLPCSFPKGERCCWHVVGSCFTTNLDHLLPFRFRQVLVRRTPKAEGQLSGLQRTSGDKWYYMVLNIGVAVWIEIKVTWQSPQVGRPVSFSATGSLALDPVGGLGDDDDLAMDQVVQQPGARILLKEAAVWELDVCCTSFSLNMFSEIRPYQYLIVFGRVVTFKVRVKAPRSEFRIPWRHDVSSLGLSSSTVPTHRHSPGFWPVFLSHTIGSLHVSLVQLINHQRKFGARFRGTRFVWN